MIGNAMYYFLEIIKSCSVCRDSYCLEKSSKIKLVAETEEFIRGDSELEDLCRSCNGRQGLVFEEVCRWTDSIFVARN